MISFGFSYTDWRKIVWTLVQGVLGYALAATLDWVPGQPWSWRAFAVGTLAALFSAAKNFVLADESPIK